MLVGMRLGPKKRTYSASINVALAVEPDLSEAASFKKVSLKPTSKCTDFILDSLRNAKLDNHLLFRLAAIPGQVVFSSCHKIIFWMWQSGNSTLGDSFISSLVKGLIFER